jgi:hypothetical protein
MRITVKYMAKPIQLTVLLAFLTIFGAYAQDKNQETTLKREVTLYNPYKPSLNEVRKISFLPDLNDTVRVRPVFNYAVSAKPFSPDYSVSPIKAAVLQPDALPKLYKGYIGLGYGNHMSPFADLSITNERSKKGAFGFYGHHFSSSDDVVLENAKRVYGGYMDNDASLFGKAFFAKNTFEASLNYTQRVRHAYGYNPDIFDYNPAKKDLRMNYSNAGAKASLTSLNLDSSSFSYDFRLFYNYFYHLSDYTQNNGGLDGYMAKSFKGYYVGSGISFVDYHNSDSTGVGNQYIFALNPFLKKRTDQWNYKLGFQALFDRNSTLHLYPDLELGFTIIPSYLSFFAALSGKMERNDPLKIAEENPYLVNNQYPAMISRGNLFKIPDTDHKLIVSAGLKGNTGGEGNYLISASYSRIDNLIFYTNILFPDTITPRAMGNYFLPITDHAELTSLHAEMNGKLTGKLSYWLKATYYHYSLDIEEHPWNRPEWDGKFGLKYNLRDKIIASLDMTALGKRWEVINGAYQVKQAGLQAETMEMPVHFNLNIMGEYRYSRILSFWIRCSNISFDHYNEWAYYPTYRFVGLVGFTYNL